MKLPQIRLTSQAARIQIQKTSAQQRIRQPKAEMSIQQPKAELSIKTIPSQLTIDQTQAWEDMNLMHISKRIETFADEGRQGAMEGISRRAQQGSQLMEIENGGNPIAEQAHINAFDQMKRIGITFIPSHFSVKTNYEPADVQVDATVNEPIIDVQPQKPVHTYIPGDVSISIRQYPDVQIDFVNLFSESV
ncbi:DUF6470 family protein [Lentibacillus salicampi]|uniref:YviE n=1 Tax=Lentibacillus salicampi TaxID=175306 RepID=A0A4Y9AG02_9BACI|nr:DUF6470 family protein [Lentibacillus salicampi]TFJ93304.1 hypothetical protein E4U82_07395 [Lentibacillus salicampi]